MYICLDGTTQRLVSKLTEENKATKKIGNWTSTPMKTHGIHFWQDLFNIYCKRNQNKLGKIKIP